MDITIVVMLIILFLVVWRILSCKKESYQPFLMANGTSDDTPLILRSDHPAPWIPKKTPLPKAVNFEANPQLAKLLSQSVDPGAHLECSQWCATKGSGKQFMDVCINTCLQKKWTDPDLDLKTLRI
jgi:predicted DNA-binding protein (MmcQ/YjbR family)